MEDRPKFLKAMIFPYDNVDMEKQLEILSKPKHNGSPFIYRYQIDNHKFIQILNWDKHQKPHHTEAESKIPPTPPLNTKEKGMGMGMEKQLNPSRELKNGETTVIEPLINYDNGFFEKFWSCYPKKKSKGIAEKVWLKIKPDEPLFEKIISTLEQLKMSEDWNKDNGKYIPHPSTWLNAKGWEDEVMNINKTPAYLSGIKKFMDREEKKDGEKQLQLPNGKVGGSV